MATALRAIEQGADATAVIPPMSIPVLRTKHRSPLALARRGTGGSAGRRAPGGAGTFPFGAPAPSSQPAVNREPVLIADDRPKAKPQPFEASRDRPILPRPPVVRLKPLAPVSVEAGQAVEVTIEIERENLPGEIMLSLAAPKGVAIEPLRFAPGETKLTARLTASAEAQPGSSTVAIVATAGSESPA